MTTDPSYEEVENRVRDVELRLRELHVEMQQTAARRKPKWLSPVWATIIVAFIGFATNAVVGRIQSANSQAIEKLRLESDLILKAIETGDHEAAAKNLTFLLDAGLISDPEGRIARLREDASGAPMLPSPERTYRLDAAIVLYESSDCAEPSLTTLTPPGTRNLGGDSDKVRSIEVKGGYWVVYQHAEWHEHPEIHGSGASKALGKGRYTQSDLEKWGLDKGISSVKFVGHENSP